MRDRPDSWELVVARERNGVIELSEGLTVVMKLRSRGKPMVKSFSFNKAIISEYLLQLGNGLGWQLAVTAQVKSEVAELARIIGLSSAQSNGYPKLIFIRGARASKTTETRRSRLAEDFERELLDCGWNAHDLDLLKIWSHNEVGDSVCEMLHEEDNYLLSLSSMRFALYPIYQAVQDSEGLPLHSALVERNGKGVLLAGPRETGKSTCCRRIPKPWHTLCDEETLIVRNSQKRYLAHPFPTWSEYLEERSMKTWDIQGHTPLCAAFFLEQATRNEAIPLGHGEAAVLIYQSAMQVMYRYWKGLDQRMLSTKKRNLFENSCKLSESVPAFKLRVSLNGRFWEKIETVIP